ncbi:hypothetical protein [Kitasatospora sp. NPDC088783]|uniref:hypothetical protein n=1 Tax=Kitasatospora sp. NPDC088783 TaxID=3364077 RepID=UPI0038215F49
MRSSLGLRRVAALALAAAAGTAVSACSGPSVERAASPAVPSGTAGPAAAAFDPADPATWKLPLEAYLPTEDEEGQLRRALGSLVEECVHRAGFSDWHPAATLPKLGPKTLTDWRYGIHDAELSATRGYHPDAAEQAAYDAVVQEAALDGGDKADSATLFSCGQQGAEKLGRTDKTVGELAQRLANESFTRSKQEPAVVRAFAQWSACMKQSGYDYKEPLDASDDPKVNGRDVTPAEIDTAMADLGCRERTGVARTWYDAEVALQKKAEEDNAQALREERKQLDDVLKTSAKTIAGGR